MIQFLLLKEGLFIGGILLEIICAKSPCPLPGGVFAVPNFYRPVPLRPPLLYAEPFSRNPRPPGYRSSSLRLTGGKSSLWTFRNRNKLQTMHNAERGESGTTMNCIVICHFGKWQELSPVCLLIGDVTSQIPFHHCRSTGTGMKRRARSLR